MSIKLEHLGIHAKDPEALSDWYCDTLGLEVTQKLEKSGRPPVYFLRSEVGGGKIEILPIIQENEKGRELKTSGFTHIGFTTNDFKEAIAYLGSRGISLHGVRDTSRGWKIGYFEDPEGNTIEIVQR